MSEETHDAPVRAGSGHGGKYIRLPKIYREKLSRPMPSEAIKQHPTKTFLSTIKAIYIQERLNDVFGVGGWDFEHEAVDKLEVGENNTPYVVVAGRIYLREFDLYTPIQYGGHALDAKGTEPADGYKSAVTDALGKCASLLEIGIQVFKGKPESQEVNKSKRLDPDEKKAESSVEEPTSIAEPAEPVQVDEGEAPSIVKKEKYEPQPKPESASETEPPAPEPTDEGEVDKHGRPLFLIAKYEELYGKKPIWNMSVEKLEAAIAEKGGTVTPSSEPEPEPAPDPSPVMQDDPPPPMVDDEPPAEEDVVDVYAADAEPVEAEEVSSEEVDEQTTIYQKYVADIEGYSDATELKNSAEDIVFEADMDGANEETQKLLKQAINNHFKAIK